MAATNMQGKVALVTGATDGIGKATAHALAAMGATLVVVGRNPAKIAATVAEIKQRSGNQQIASLQADFAELAQVRRLAREFLARYQRLDALVNNAGIIFSQRGETVDGFERTFAINHLAPFLLTNLLLERIVASAPARIVNVSSAGHAMGSAKLDDLQSTRSYNGMRVYGQSKLDNLLFTYELARRLQGTGVTVNALHPGGVATNMGHDQTGLVERLLGMTLRRLGQTPENGARTSIYLASSPAVANVTGKYFIRSKPRRSSAASYDVAAQQKLWQISAELTGIANQAPLLTTTVAAD
jgi:NAD(P)-dependent dehydrogenase (short-subunit alcohol dehydrogenase family)